MRVLDKLRLRVRSLLRRQTVETELAEELQFHLDQLTEENIASGMTAKEARTAALRSMGGFAQYQEQCRDMRQSNFIEDMGRDFRHALRVLLRAPGFTAVAVLTLALGIGATTAIFSVVYSVLLKPLPFHEPERLVGLYHRASGLNIPLMNQGPATYFTYIDNQQSFESIGAWDRRELSITGRGEPERVEAVAVSAGTLPLLRVSPHLGRIFTEEDDQPGTPMRVVLSYGYWQRKFGGAHDVLGRLVEVDGGAATIVGVLPPSFTFLRQRPALLVPLQPNRADAGSVSFDFQGLARLKPGVTLAAARADVARMITTLDQVPGFTQLRLEPIVHPLADDVTGNVGRFLWILLGAVGVVLLIACTNVANLFLVRAEGRQQELAVRAALGASRTRIARELLSESLILGLAGGVVGVLFAQAAVQLLQSLAPPALPRLDEISIDAVVLLFAAILSCLSSVLFGIIPALRFGTLISVGLKEGGRSTSHGPVRQRTRSILVVAEVAMALVLLIVSGLMIRTFLAMQQVKPGFTQPESVQTFRIEIPELLIQDEVQMVRTHDQIAQRLRQMPGVVSVGLASSITMDGEDNGNPLRVEQVHVRPGEMPPLRRYRSVGPGFFQAMGNSLIAGRDITWADIYQRRRVVIISENLAREYWGSATNALGKRVQGSQPAWYEIVGVAGEERDDGLTQPATPIVYWPLLNENYVERNIAYAVRSSRVGSPGFMSELQQVVWSVQPQLPLANVSTLEEIQADSAAQTSFAMVMLGLAASVALLMGLVGIYGVIAYVASQRRREIGIRIALGAQTRDVRRLFLCHGMALAAAGIAIGAGVSLAVTRVMSSLLFGVSSLDWATYVVVSAIMATVALLATWIPARRAAQVDPAIVLRSEG